MGLDCFYGTWVWVAPKGAFGKKSLQGPQQILRPPGAIRYRVKPALNSRRWIETLWGIVGAVVLQTAAAELRHDAVRPGPELPNGLFNATKIPASVSPPLRGGVVVRVIPSPALRLAPLCFTAVCPWSSRSISSSESPAGPGHFYQCSVYARSAWFGVVF